MQSDNFWETISSCADIWLSSRETYREGAGLLDLGCVQKTLRKERGPWFIFKTIIWKMDRNVAEGKVDMVVCSFGRFVTIDWARPCFGTCISDLVGHKTNISGLLGCLMWRWRKQLQHHGSTLRNSSTREHGIFRTLALCFGTSGWWRLIFFTPVPRKMLRLVSPQLLLVSWWFIAVNYGWCVLLEPWGGGGTQVEYLTTILL